MMGPYCSTLAKRLWHGVARTTEVTSVMPWIDSAPPPDLRLRFGFVAAEHFVPLARRVAVGALRRWEISPSVSDDAAMVVSELVTNAVAIADGLWVELRLSVRTGKLVVDMWDPSPLDPDKTPRRPADDVTAGRGLLIVDALATWEIVRTPEPGGKSVIAYIEVPDTAEPVDWSVA